MMGTVIEGPLAAADSERACVGGRGLPGGRAAGGARLAVGRRAGLGRGGGWPGAVQRREGCNGGLMRRGCFWERFPCDRRASPAFRPSQGPAFIEPCFGVLSVPDSCTATAAATGAQRPPQPRPPSPRQKRERDGSNLQATALLSAASSQVSGRAGRPARSIFRAGDAGLRTAQWRNPACEFGPRSAAFFLVDFFLSKRSAFVMDV